MDQEEDFQPEAASQHVMAEFTTSTLFPKLAPETTESLETSTSHTAAVRQGWRMPCMSDHILLLEQSTQLASDKH